MDAAVGFLCIDVHWRTRLRFRTIIDIMHPLMPGGCKFNDYPTQKTIGCKRYPVLSFQIERGYSGRRDQPDDRSDGGEGVGNCGR